MMQRNALAEIKRLIIKRLPVQAQLQIMLQIHPLVRPRGHAPKRTPQLPVVHPDLHVRPIQKLIQPARVVEMQVPDDDLLDILDLIASRFDRGAELVARLVADPCEDVRERRPPDFRVVFAAAGFPEDEALVRVLDQDAVAGEFAAFVDEGFGFGGLGGRVAAAHDEGFVAFQPAHFQHVEFRAGWAHVGDVVGHGAAGELGLDGGHG